MNLDNILPLEGMQDYLLRDWIPASEFAKVKPENGGPDVYHDGTYDWYGGIARAVQPKTILEIGVYRGYSLAAMVKGAPKSVSHVVAVDNGYELGMDIPVSAVNRLITDFPAVIFTLIECDTQKEEFPRSKKTVPAQYDIVHIDADHSYEGCLNDLRNFAPLVSENGVVIVHDTKDEPVRRAVFDFLADNRLHYREIDNVKGMILLAR